jgi:2-C-methyl-D-erythritol 4-phosphate cytidylyltransferase
MTAPRRCGVPVGTHGQGGNGALRIVPRGPVRKSPTTTSFDETAMTAPRFFALIPAAGAGARMGLDGPKQYAMLGGRAVIDRTLDAFRACPAITATFVVLSPDDRAFEWASEEVVPLYCGGATRRDSVLAGLEAMGEQVRPDDWVLVHDAARPGVTVELIERLIAECRDDAVGGLLALPVADTLKRAEDAAADEHARGAVTVERSGLWAAQTPQMFRSELLLRALRASDQVTDEAGAVEALGLRPKLVRGSPRNFKLTYRDDLALAAALFGAH